LVVLGRFGTNNVPIILILDNHKKTQTNANWTT
jgi:hypothetical protein